jgi:uncharacterized protein YbjQ (UPF0145 family)
MKKCPKCGKVYDNSWGVCFDDKTKLETYAKEDEIKYKGMIVTTTPNIEGKEITSYLGVVSGISIMGFGLIREFFAGFTDVFGGKSKAYQKEYIQAQKFAIDELKKKVLNLNGNAVVGIRLDFDNITAVGKAFIMVTATGTAVKYEDSRKS